MHIAKFAKTGPIRRFGTLARHRPWSARKAAHLILFPCAVLTTAAGSPASAAPPANTGTYNNSATIAIDVTSNTGFINNNSPGVWNGNIVSNAHFINNNAGARWNGNVQSNVDTINNFAGGIWIGSVSTSGDLKNFGSWAGQVLSNTVKIENHDGAIWTGAVVNNQAELLNFANGHWVGDVLAQSSTGELNNYGNWLGTVTGNAGTIYNDGVWTGAISGNAYRIINNLLDPTNGRARWVGNVLANDGTVINYINGAWQGDVVANANAVSNYAAWTGNVGSNNGTVTNRGVWTGGVLSNDGTINNNTGAAWTGDVASNAGSITNLGVWTGSFRSSGNVMAQNRINGAFTNNGLLQLTGSLAGLTTLTNNGTLDLRGGGAAQTLTAAEVDFGAGSVYGLDVDSAGHADTIVATNAALRGTVRVKASVAGAPYNATSHYVILSAANITGTFDGVTTDVAFLDPRLSYADPQVVALDLVRNDLGFAQVGRTPNEKATAAAAEALGAGNPIYGAILWLTEAQAAQAFDALSGEAYPSLATASIENASILAKAVTGHLDQAFDAVGDSAGSASSYAEPYTPEAGAAYRNGIWGEVHGVLGDFATPGFAGMSSTVGGVSLGLDGLLGDWRLGAVLQAGTNGVIVDERATSATSSDYGGGLYGGTEWGDTRLLLGALYTHHDIRASRTVVFPGFADALSGDYAAGTAQAFAELSHQFDFGAASLRPFANFTFMRHTTDAFTETGGAAALSTQSSLIDATFVTLGFAAARQFVVGDDMLLTASASLGWRHAFSSQPTFTSAFSGGAGFIVAGTPMAADMFVLSAGLNLDVSAATTMDFTYNGQIGSGAQTHTLRATWDTRF